jgi:prolyl-tRNA editing enzyme YbaK/EbsC (Cys-tRNA(Pro) deacylase)
MTAGSAVAPAHAAPPAPLSLALRKIPGAVRAGSTPAKLGLWLAGLLAASLAWGAVAAWTVAEHAAAAGNVATVSEPLSLDAQQIYRSLSAADATEAAAFLSGGLEPLSLRARYQADITQAARQLETATAAAGQSAAGSSLATLSTGLPRYAGLVETARADNRLGLPLGAAYLREASEFMRATLLPAAGDLSSQENAQLAAADQQATGLPWAALAVALIAALLLAAGQWWLARRANRIVNPGLLIASIAGLASLVWLVTALTVARTHLIAARDHGSAPVEALARAETAALQAHADESLTLINRDTFADDLSQADFVSQQKRLGPGPGTLLTDAAAIARGSPGGPQAAAALGDAPTWYIAHQQVRSLDDSGHYTAAVHWALGNSPAGSGHLFGVLDTDLTGAIAADQASFRSAAQQGRDDLAFLEAGMIAASLVMVAGCAWGISRRLAEYR